MANPTTGEFESEADAVQTGTDLPALWLKHIERAKKDEDGWRKTAKAAVEVYEAQAENAADVPAFNILHANIETTVPALYNSSPVPDVRRRYGDVDPVVKQAVDVIERGLSYCVDKYDFDGALLEAVRDSEIAGRAFVRVRYEPELIDNPLAQPGALETDTSGNDSANSTVSDQPAQIVGQQKLLCEHVIWDKWGHSPARTWSQVTWIYFEHDFTRDDLETLGLDDDRIKRLTFNDTGRGDDKRGEAQNAGVWKTVRGFEIWDKRRRKVLFVAEQDRKEFLAVRDDPLGLEEFYPGVSLQPLRTRKDLTPICPYEIYQPLVSELDTITRRIKSLINQCRVRGMVDKRLQADMELIRSCDDGQYVPADDATAFATGGGGLEKAIAHWPLQQIVVTLKELYVQREQIKQTIYEVTGLSDVLRGATDPRETLGAQQLKAQSGSQRLSQRQSIVARFARDLFRIKAEILCEHFTPENLSTMTGVQITPEVHQVLQSDMLRSYKIDIESDSTIRADVGRSQEQMANFLQGTAQYASAMAPVLQLSPGAAAPVIEIYAAFARNFKLGKSAEDALDKLVQQAQQPQQPQEPKPDPEEQKMQMQMQAEQQKLSLQQQAEQQKAAREQEKMQADLSLAQQKAGIEMQIKTLELQTRQQLAALEIEKAQMELGIKREALALDRDAKINDVQTKRELNVIDIETRRGRNAASAEKNEMAQ